MAGRVSGVWDSTEKIRELFEKNPSHSLKRVGCPVVPSNAQASHGNAEKAARLHEAVTWL